MSRPKSRGGGGGKMTSSVYAGFHIVLHPQELLSIPKIKLGFNKDHAKNGRNRGLDCLHCMYINASKTAQYV